MRNKIIIFVALVAVFFVSGWVFQAPKQQWEYKVENGVSEKKFNELGAQGWELTSCGQMGGGLPYYVFKRVK